MFLHYFIATKKDKKQTQKEHSQYVTNYLPQV